MARIDDASNRSVGSIHEAGEPANTESRTQEAHDHEATASARPDVTISGEIGAAGLRARVEADLDELGAEPKGTSGAEHSESFKNRWDSGDTVDGGKLDHNSWGTRFDRQLLRVKDADGNVMPDHGITARANLQAAVGDLLMGGVSGGMATGMGLLGGPGWVVAGVVGLVSGFWLGKGVANLAQAAYHGIMDGLGRGYQGPELEDHEYKLHDGAI